METQTERERVVGRSASPLRREPSCSPDHPGTSRAGADAKVAPRTPRGPSPVAVAQRRRRRGRASSLPSGAARLRPVADCWDVTPAYIHCQASSSNLATLGRSSGRSFDPSSCSSSKSPRDGRSAMFALDATYSNQTRARSPRLKPWNACTILHESGAREYPLTRAASAPVLSIQWITLRPRRMSGKVVYAATAASSSSWPMYCCRSTNRSSSSLGTRADAW